MDEMGLDGMRRDGMGYDWMGWDGTGWDGMGWQNMGWIHTVGHVFPVETDGTCTVRWDLFFYGEVLGEAWKYPVGTIY